MDDWGGSEELWARAMPFIKEVGYTFTLYKDRINRKHPEMQQLNAQGVHFIEMDEPRSIIKRTTTKLKNKLLSKERSPFYTNSPHALVFRKNLLKNRPAFVIIAQGINFDGTGYAYQCMQLQIPYCIIVQKAVDFFWPAAKERSLMIKVFQKAQKCYFVSRHNQRLTEEQFGIRFTNAQQVWNPVKISRQLIPYPVKDQQLRLACVGRLFIIDKGQDILLRVLSEEPWKSRPVTVSFIGSGHDEDGLKELTKLLNVKNVDFAGHRSDIESLWKDYHALILPSRSEGMALSVLEAMAAGRPVIVTDAGGHEDLIKHGITGFIADATKKDLARVMEEAWQQQERWRDIGINANKFINEVIPSSPEKQFAESILTIIS